MSLGKKINDFEKLAEQTLAKFNQHFDNSPNLLGYETKEGFFYFAYDMEVEIGEIVGPENVRRVSVGAKNVNYSFNTTSNLPDVGDLNARVFDGKIWLNKSGASMKTIITNAELENTIMEQRELELEPIEYMVLQYLRGCQSPYHTQVEIAAKMRKSLRGVRNVLKQMEQKQIIKTAPIVNMHRMVITVNEDWA